MQKDSRGQEAAAGRLFRMEDGSLLSAARSGKESRAVEESFRDGDIVFRPARGGGASAFLRPAGKSVSMSTVEKAAGLVASVLRGRSMRPDGPEGKSYSLLIGVWPSAPAIELQAAPAPAAYSRGRSLRAVRRRRSVKVLSEEIAARIERGETEKALKTAEEIKSLPAGPREKAVSAMLKKFASAVRRIERDGRFAVPLLLSAQRSLAESLAKLDPGPGYPRSPRGRALVVPAGGDPGEMKAVIGDIFRAAGYEASAADASPEETALLVKKEKPSVLVLCGLMPSSFAEGMDPLQRLKECRSSVKKLIGRLEAEGLRGGVEIILAGLAFNRKFLREVSADALYRSLNSLVRGLFENGKENRV